jgi:hypothetical protein
MITPEPSFGKRRNYGISEQFRKTEFFRFLLLFCTNKEQIKNKILSQRVFPAVQNQNQLCLIKNKIDALQKVKTGFDFCAYFGYNICTKVVML